MSEIVRMEHYSFTYAGQQSPAIRNVCLSVRQGDFILLTGKSGSGKSTLLRQMKRELVPAGEISGEIRINGKDLSEISQRESAVTVGYLGQNIEQQIVAEKVWQELVFGLENLGWNQDRMEKKIRQMARLFSLEEWMEKNMSQLSGGQKQRVLLASILAMEPNVLLLDEPTAQLDDAMAKEFLREVARGNRECRTAVLLAEHRIRYALPYSSRSCRMENGRLLETTGKKADFFPLVRRGERKNTQRDDMGVVLRDVTFFYEKGKGVLNRLSLRVPRGTFLQIVGPNGCGKTTLLQLICGIRKPCAGTVECYGKAAMVPQNPKALFSELTAGEELLSESLFDELGLGGLEQAHPYDLSGGQQQRLAIGKVLETKPDILLLDEPTRGLDNDCKTMLGVLLERLAEKGMTVLCVTHDGEFSEQYGTIYHLPI